MLDEKLSGIRAGINDLLKENIETIIILGYGLAISGDRDYIDKVVVPAYMKRPFSQNEDRIKLTSMSSLPSRLLKNPNPNVRDYGATLLGAYFCAAAPEIEPDQRVMRTLDSLISDLLKVALTDSELWPRFRASMALLHAQEYCAAPFVKDKVKETYSALKANLEEGISQDPELTEKTRKYLAYMQGEANTLPFVA